MAEEWKEPLGEGVRLTVSPFHRFTTDSVLLASFSYQMSGAGSRAADLCAGNGVIPFLWLARERREGKRKFSRIDMVELQPEAHLLCEKSVLEHGEEERMFPHLGDLRRLEGVLPAGRFDFVSCNPPYKALGGGIQNAAQERRAARHESFCSLEELSASAARLLRFGGKFCLCQRPERLCDVLCALREAKIEPKYLRLVQQRRDKEPSLFLLCGIRGGKPGMRCLPTLQIEEGGGFSDEMREIYGPDFFRERE